MDVGATFAASSQTPELVQPADGPLHGGKGSGKGVRNLFGRFIRRFCHGSFICPLVGGRGNAPGLRWPRQLAAPKAPSSSQSYAPGRRPDKKSLRLRKVLRAGAAGQPSDMAAEAAAMAPAICIYPRSVPLCLRSAWPGNLHFAPGEDTTTQGISILPPAKVHVCARRFARLGADRKEK
jgi:hypothetical protein